MAANIAKLPELAAGGLMHPNATCHTRGLIVTQRMNDPRGRFAGPQSTY